MRRSQRALLAAAVLAMAVTACGKGGGGGAGQKGPPPLAVDVAQAQRRDIATYVTLDGQIAPVQESTLSSPQSGNVAAVYVNEGQHVSRGQLLAKLDDSTLRASLAQQEAIVQTNTAQLGSSTLQAPVTAANASNTIVSAQQQVAAAHNNTASAQAAYQSALSTYNADRQLLAQGYVAQTQFDQARAQYVQTQQALNTARESERQAQVALRAAQSQGTNAVPIQQQAIAVNRGQLAAAQAQARLLQTQIAQTAIVSPFDGVVTQRLLDPGAFASPNQPVVRVSQIDTVYVNVNVPDDDLPYVHSGTPVTFTTSSLGNRSYNAAVMDVNATPTQGTLSYRARVRVANPGDRLRGGMLVSVTVRKEYHPNAIVVPRTAVFQSENGSNVFTVANLPAPQGGAAGAGGQGGGAAAGGGAPGGAASGPGARSGKRGGAGGASAAGGAGGPGGAGGAGGPGGAPPIKLMQANVVPVQVGLQTDTLTEIRSPQVQPGTTVITTRPDALQDKSVVAISNPAPGGRRGGAQ
ncbi:MAG: efflux RND transporter periplasmic adaptor subunit [Candidatus Eremiobacteraeota bacterium]|nr:efflux RND transporter periplasmic adaptor subunit [Candidatus Eremiobacteraeota bacterium]